MPPDEGITSFIRDDNSLDDGQEVNEKRIFNS